MKIMIAPGIEGVTDDLTRFVERVMVAENLEYIDVDIWGCKNEGICAEFIAFGLCDTEEETKALFLHEVGHVFANKINWDDSYWHREGWQKEYDRLCWKYLGKVSSLLPSFV